jgi:hypothetical protein
MADGFPDLGQVFKDSRAVVTVFCGLTSDRSHICHILLVGSSELLSLAQIQREEIRFYLIRGGNVPKFGDIF